MQKEFVHSTTDCETATGPPWQPRFFPMQVAHGLLMHWESQLVAAGTDRSKRRLGLEDLLTWAGLPYHASKSGLGLTCCRLMTGTFSDTQAPKEKYDHAYMHLPASRTTCCYRCAVRPHHLLQHLQHTMSQVYCQIVLSISVSHSHQSTQAAVAAGAHAVSCYTCCMTSQCRSAHANSLIQQLMT